MNRLFLSLPEPCGGTALPWYDCGDGVIMKYYQYAKKNDFEFLCAKAEDIGFFPVECKELDGNLYRTYRIDKALLHIYYIPYEHVLRVIFDDFSADYMPAKKTAAEKATLWQFETDHTFIDCGMCYIFRCPDESFFIIDSGHFCAVKDHDRIYRFLRERTPDGKNIVVSGWLFTHGHDDHICVFLDIMKDAHADLTVEKIYYNFVPVTHRDNLSWNVNDRAGQLDFEAYVKALHIPIVKPHSGQSFDVGGLSVQILCTQEDVYPGSLANYNDSSLIFTVSGKDFRIFFPGDAGYAESDIITRRHSEATLKSDVIQAAHHGHLGVKKDFYRKVSAPVILFPNTRIKFDEEYINYEENPYAVSLAQRYYVSAEGTVEIPLPLDIEKIKVLPDETDEDFDAIKNLWGYTYTDEFKKAHKAAFQSRQK